MDYPDLLWNWHEVLKKELSGLAQKGHKGLRSPNVNNR